MRQRCYYPKHVAYRTYGGRGVSICDEWRDDFVAFRDWAVAAGYSDDLTIDRIDGNGNYEPDNCRWVSRAEQAHNTRTTKLTMAIATEIRSCYASGMFTMRDLAAKFGIAPSGVHKLIHNQSWQA